MTDSEKSCYVTGFADGEGSFNMSWRKRDDCFIGWKMAPVFNISQKGKPILTIIQEHLQCGSIPFRNDGVWVYEVDNKNDLIFTIIPFFERFPFLSEKKRRDFSRFKQIVGIIYQGNKSKTYQDISTLLNLISDVEAKHARKYTDTEILERAANFWSKNK